MSNIFKKLAAVRDELGPIGMDGVNTHFKYKYTSHTAVATLINSVVQKHGLYFRFNVVDFKVDLMKEINTQSRPNGESMTNEKVSGLFLNGFMSVTVFDTDTGESVMLHEKFPIFSKDNGEQCLGKALTYACKYFYFTEFNMVRDEFADPDSGGRDNNKYKNDQIPGDFNDLPKENPRKQPSKQQAPVTNKPAAEKPKSEVKEEPKPEPKTEPKQESKPVAEEKKPDPKPEPEQKKETNVDRGLINQLESRGIELFGDIMANANAGQLTNWTVKGGRAGYFKDDDSYRLWMKHRWGRTFDNNTPTKDIMKTLLNHEFQRDTVIFWKGEKVRETIMKAIHDAEKAGTIAWVDKNSMFWFDDVTA